jgi:hypothetical protein
MYRAGDWINFFKSWCSMWSLQWFGRVWLGFLLSLRGMYVRVVFMYQDGDWIIFFESWCFVWSLQWLGCVWLGFLLSLWGWWVFLTYSRINLKFGTKILLVNLEIRVHIG